MFSTPYVSMDSSILSNAVYMALHRIAWAIALAYVIFTCENQRRGSIIRWFLSHPYWKPIGTMGLSLYVTHVIYMMLTLMDQKQVYYFSFWSMVSMEYKGTISEIKASNSHLFLATYIFRRLAAMYTYCCIFLFGI